MKLSIKSVASLLSDDLDMKKIKTLKKDNPDLYEFMLEKIVYNLLDSEYQSVADTGISVKELFKEVKKASKDFNPEEIFFSGLINDEDALQAYKNMKKINKDWTAKKFYLNGQGSYDKKAGNKKAMLTALFLEMMNEL